jgi:hypothetical protein
VCKKKGPATTAKPFSQRLILLALSGGACGNACGAACGNVSVVCRHDRDAASSNPSLHLLFSSNHSFFYAGQVALDVGPRPEARKAAFP